MQNPKFEFDRTARFAHDIRSPLAAIDLVVKSLKGIEPSSRDLLISCSQKVREIADSILGYHAHNCLRSVPIVQLLQDAVVLKSVELSRINLDLVVDASVTPNTKVFANQAELSRVLSNLLNNAAEASGGGLVAVRVAVSQELKEAIIQITDNGPGFASLLKGRAGVVQVSTKSSGCGLGLISAVAAMRQMNGRLEIDSDGTSGARVVLSLMLADS